MLPVALVAWLLLGPLASGWASRAGTPSELLAGATPSDSASGASAESGVVGPGYRAGFAGTVTQSRRGSTSTITVTGTLDRGASGTLAVSLDARDDGAGSLLVRDGTVTVVDTSGRTIFDGSVSDVRDSVLVASGRSPTSQLTIQFDTFDTRAGTASGTVRATGS
jgi:hypothetical protein